MHKFRFWLVLFAIMLLSMSCRPIPTDDDNFNAENPGAVKTQTKLEIQSFRDILKLKPEFIDIADACFLLEKENGWATDEQRAKAEQILEFLVTKVARSIRSYDTDERRVRKLVDTIFNEGFKVDKTDPEGHNPANLYMTSVLLRRKGYCVSLSFVALAVAKRLKTDRKITVPIRGIRAPKHFFIRYVSENKGLEKNFEMTNYGANRDKFKYFNALGLPLAYVNVKPYFHALDNKQIFSDLINNVGANYILADNNSEALRWLQIAREFDPDNPQPVYNQAYIYEQQEDLANAISHLNKALELDTNFFEARIARGRLYCDQGNPREGLKDFEFAIENYKDRHEAFLMRGVYFAKNEDYDAALTDLQRAQKVKPFDKDTNMNLLNLYLRQNMLDDAAPVAEILEDIAPDDPQTLKLLAIYNKLLKEKEK